MIEKLKFFDLWNMDIAIFFNLVKILLGTMHGAIFTFLHFPPPAPRPSLPSPQAPFHF